jgi:hypothetical protein
MMPSIAYIASTPWGRLAMKSLRKLSSPTLVETSTGHEIRCQQPVAGLLCDIGHVRFSVAVHS